MKKISVVINLGIHYIHLSTGVSLCIPDVVDAFVAGVSLGQRIGDRKINTYAITPPDKEPYTLIVDLELGEGFNVSELDDIMGIKIE
jgi:hypothetical protein